MQASEAQGVRHTSHDYPVRRFASKAQWTAYAEWLRRHARVSLALLPEPPRGDLNAQVFGTWQGQGFTCEKVSFESLPGLLVTGNLFRPVRPRARKRQHPGILCPHGHWQDGRLHDWDPAGSVVARCIQLARMGATVFSYDMVGYNDSCQLPHRAFGAGDPHWGLSLMALQTWNSIRALDFLLSLPGVDRERIGVTGCSGGATQTFTLTAVDERVAAAAPICMVSYSYQGGCLCENAPLLRLDGTNVELTRLFAPRPLFLGSCTRDWTANTPEKELPALREIYRLYGRDDRVCGLHVDADHNYNLRMREAVYGFLNRWLFGARSDAPVPESVQPYERPPLRDRMVWWGRKAPGTIEPAAVRRLWRARCKAALRPHLREAVVARNALGPLLPHVLGIAPSSGSRHRGPDARSVAISLDRGALIVTPAREAPVRQTDAEFHTTYNRSAFAQSVHEILGALDRTRGPLRLVGKGRAAPACLLAGAVSKRVGALDVDMCGFDPDDDRSWGKHFDTPCIRQVGGLATAFALIGSRPMRLRHATDAVKRLAARYAR